MSAIGQSLFSRIRREARFTVRMAGNDDWPAIERLLFHAHRHYMALEWWTVQEWLGRPTFLLSFDRQERLVGLMLSVGDDSPVAWLRAVVITSESCFMPMLEASLQVASAQDKTGLAFLGNTRWILSHLRPAGFEQVNQVITLRRQGKWSARAGPSGIGVRAATPADIEEVVAVDHAAFPPMWWYDRRVLSRALDLARCFHVAHLADTCVGYQFSTLRGGRGHIVRLATHPRWQHRGVGGRLLSEAMTALDRAGAEQVTVNTQEDNLASQYLYRRFAFDRVGRPWAVWLRALGPG